MNSFYSNEELRNMGFKSLGKNVLLSRRASIYGADRISIGDNTRIDDFCILSGNIEIGKHTHISAYVGMFAGQSGIVMDDYVAVSSRCAIYAESDDYSGEYMTNPMIPDKFRNVTKAGVKIEKHCIVGTGSTILPGVTLEEGASIGAMSLIIKDVPKWTINVGIPCKTIKMRSKKMLEYEKKFEEEYSNMEEK